MNDPFATAALRERVVAAWAASPARLREDANAEEDLALGGYRDRVVVELAQNAADAATAAGIEGVLRLTLRDGPDGPVLVAANTGAPLTDAGVEALSTLRASAKRDGTGVGRFGVGFSAVLAVSDEPAVLSRTGAVRWSREDAAAVVAEAAAGAPALAEEVRRRSGHVPVLRLPFATEGEPPQGFDTAVVLPLRDEAASDVVRRLLAELDDALLLALPGLRCVEVDLEGDVRVLEGAAERWVVRRTGGTWTPAERAELLADRPTEERDRPTWSITWAVPREALTAGRHAIPGLVQRDVVTDLLAQRHVAPTGAGAGAEVAGVVHAPTPTDEPLAWPALLLASFPLDPSRRHVAPGPLTDRLVREAAAAYADLLREQAAEGVDVLPLVPTGLPAGALDGALREAVLAVLPETPVLHPVEDHTLSLRPRDAVVLAGASGADDGVLTALAPVVAGLVAAPSAHRAALRALAVRELPLVDVIELLPTAGEPSTWRDRYAGLTAAAIDPVDREALAALPVPLADGRVVRGARGLVLPAEGVVPQAFEVLATYGLRVVHPEAVHPLLERLGAAAATARGLLEDPATRAAVADSPDSEDPDLVADAVLGLVERALADGALNPGELPWLGDLALPDAEGDLAPAAALALPGSVSADLLDVDETGLLDDAVAARWSPATLAAVGVADGPALVRVADVDLADLPEEVAEVDGLEDWAEEIGPGTVAELLVLRDLDLVRDDRWQHAVAAVAADPDARAALVDPVTVVGADGRGRHVPSYSAWWLRRELDLAGRLDPGGAAHLAGLLDPAPAWTADLDQPVRRALGLVGAPGQVDEAAARALLTRMADPDVEVDAVTCLRAWGLVAAAGGLRPEDLPDVVRVPDGTGSRAVPTHDVAVADDPRWLQRSDLGPLVVVPSARAAELSDALDLPLTSDVADGLVTSAGHETELPTAVRRVLAAAGASVPERWWEHDDLTVDGHPVRWWVDADGRPHAATMDGLARALAWAVGRWPLRAALAAAVADGEADGDLLLEAAQDG